MPTLPNTLNEAVTFIHENGDLSNRVTSLFAELISLKRTHFKASEVSVEIKPLLEDSLVVSEDTSTLYSINMSNLVNWLLLLRLAERMLNKKLPDELIPALEFVDEFALEIRRPRTNHIWEADWERALKRLVMIFEERDGRLDLPGLVQTEPRKRPSVLFHFEHDYCEAMQHMPFTLERLDEVSLSLFATEHWKNAVLNGIRGVVKVDPALGVNYFNYCKEQNNWAFVANLVISLFTTDEEFYLAEALNLFDRNVKDGLWVLGALEYSASDQIETVMAYLSDKPIDESCIPNLVLFYCRILGKNVVDQNIIGNCFESVRALISICTENGDVQWGIVNQLKLLQGYEKERYGLLPGILQWKSPQQYIKGYFFNYNDPKFIFHLLGSSYIGGGSKVRFDLFESDLHSIQHRNPNAFEQEFLRLLSHQKPILNYAAIKIITSTQINSDKIDLTKLSADGQIAALTMVMAAPLTFDRLLSVSIKLKGSTHSEVKKQLKSRMVELVEAYGSHLPKHLEKYLDKKIEYDRKLLAAVKSALKSAQEIRNIKQRHIELHAEAQEARWVHLYYRLEREKNTEMQERANKETFFASFGKYTKVVRGNAYKHEESNEISMLRSLKSEFLMDMRYYLNPEAVNWDFYKLVNQ